jgi:uncharacterized protein YggE
MPFPNVPAMSLKLIFPALALFASALSFETPSAQADEPDKRTLSLSATGEVRTTPDKVDITAGVTSEGQTARAALDKNTESMTKVVDGLKAAGIAPEDIQTSNFSIAPIYEKKSQGHAAFITGYRVTNQVHVTLNDTKKLGEILDTVVSLGANRINSINFGVSEQEPLKDEARKQAMQKAIANAKLYAEAAGVELGPVQTITEEADVVMPRYAEAAAAPMGRAMDVPIEAGTTTVQARVRVTWELR